MYRVKLVAEVSQTPEEEEVLPHVVQLISPPFLGRTVLTAGPAKFGMDLSKQEHGVSSQHHIVIAFSFKPNLKHFLLYLRYMFFLNLFCFTCAFFFFSK